MTAELNYKRRLFRNYLAVAVVPAAIFLVLGAVSFLLSHRYVSRELAAINRAALEESKNAVEAILRESDAIILGISTDPIFYSQIDRLLTGPLETLDDVRLRASVLGSLKSAVNVHPYLRSIYVYMPNAEGLIATSSDDVVPKDVFPDTAWIPIGEGRGDALSYHIEARVVEPYPGLNLRFRYLTFFRNIVSSAGFTYKGFLAMNIDIGYLESVMANHRQSGSGVVMLLDSSGAVVAAAGTEEGDGSRGSYVVYETAFDKYPFSLRAMIPRATYYRLPMTLGVISILSTLTALILGMGAAYGLSRRSFRNIAAIVDIIQAAERGDPLPSPEVSSKDGYHDLIYSVLQSFMEQRYLKLQLSERDLREKTLELLALQSQMNPHFLFNTLTGISCRALAFTGGPNSVTEMIDHLAQILLYALGSPEQPVSLEDELTYAEHYVAIQTNRYKDAFAVEWRVEDDARSAQATKLLLQPLIENAIYHGVREAEGPRRIVVELRLEDEDVLVSVADDGAGMTAERLAEVRSRIDSREHPDGHIGLYNTARRLRLRYGEAARVEIRSEAGSGTVVSLRFPFLEHPSR